MKRYILAAFIVTMSAGPATAAGEVRLSLKEAIKMAVENNLDVKAELYNPASAVADIYKFKAVVPVAFRIAARGAMDASLAAR